MSTSIRNGGGKPDFLFLRYRVFGLTTAAKESADSCAPRSQGCCRLGVGVVWCRVELKTAGVVGVVVW